MNKYMSYVLCLVIIIISMLGAYSYANKHRDELAKAEYKAIVLNTKNPIKTEAVAKLGDKLNEYYIQRFRDGTNTCYIHKGSISCLKE